ncbi:MAG: FAD-binding oxidoreductase [Spirochaetales bacterium]|nr:FAD-binding oxidoreductase [Spirochaetales bacterium]
MQSGNQYSRIDNQLRAEVAEIVGESNVLFDDSAQLDSYGYDQVADRRYGHPPEMVVFPENADQISSIVKIANRDHIPVTPRGGGSGLSGGAVPVYGGICLSLKRMNRIKEIDVDNLTVSLEPGVVTKELDRELEKSGLFFAGYPMSEEFCFIGGNVAENAGGGRAVKYGVTGRYVIGLDVVLPNGEQISVGGKVYKDVAGYDLLHLFIGSEGTLGIFTGITLRLLPRPLHRTVVKAHFENDAAALGAVPALLRHRKIAPSAIEFIDTTCLKITRDNQAGETGLENPLLLIEIDGAGEDHITRRASEVSLLCLAHGGEVELAENDAEIEELWKIRKQIPWALKKLNPHLTAEDIVVPVANLPALLQTIRRLEKTHSVQIPSFGHAADGNLHSSPMRGAGLTDAEWDSLLHSLLSELYETTANLGGTISGEHGIGHKRKSYLGKALSSSHIELLKTIKSGFDPNNILNPGKIFDLP